METIVQPDADSKSNERATDFEESATHFVCGCQVDATPRLALCSADCSDGDERYGDDVCVVCWNLVHVAALIGCERCRSDEWRDRLDRMGF